MYIIKFLIVFFRLIRYTHIINKAYDEDMIVEKLSYALNSQFKRGYWAQLYTVINPYIKDGKYNPEQIMEINDMGGMDDANWITQWTMERLTIISNFITTQNLLDILTFEMSDEGDSNYLFIIRPIVFVDMLNKLRGALVELLILILIIIILLIVL